jgi:hypothetical protein
VLNYYVLLNHVPISARLHYIPPPSVLPHLVLYMISPYTFHHRRMFPL